MNLKEEDLVDIADRMLEKLEREYQEINGLGGKTQVECPEEEEEEPEGYQVIGDGDEDGPGMMSGDEDEDEEGDNNDEKGHQNHEKHPCAAAAPSTSQPCNQNQTKPHEKPQNGAQNDNEDLQNGIGELMQVFPSEQWVAPEREVNIDAQKIKTLTMKMNLPIPDWIKSEDMLRNRITELFGGLPKQK